MIIKRFFAKIYFKFRKAIYSAYSNNTNVEGEFKSYQPIILRGKGTISFGGKINIGVINSPFFYNGYAYIEARTAQAKIYLGNNININNCFSLVSEKGVTIHDNVLIGYNCSIIDSNFHSLDINERHSNDFNSKEVVISKNVFIGNNVTILKGVEIGENTVVGANSVVTKSFPSNVIIAGNPAKIIRELNN